MSYKETCVIMDHLLGIVKGMATIRNEYKIPLTKTLEVVYIEAESKDILLKVAPHQHIIQILGNIDKIFWNYRG